MINFYEMLEKQKVLDEAINHVADRDEIKIRLSMIAEIIEFQETLEETHKTWKKSEFTREDRLEEFVDIFFFWCQLLLVSGIVLEKSENEDLNKFFNYRSYHEYKVNELTIQLIVESARMIVESAYKKYGQLEFLGAIARNQGFTDDEINEMHDKKFRKNLERVGVEWA